tara:strand:- start:208 stop:816 length:609 start_codon:yes stop_codon:yes gene_type:complete
MLECLFPTFLYQEVVPFDIDIQYLKSLEYERYGCGTGYTSANQMILLEEPFAELKKQIDYHVNAVHYDVLKSSQGRPVHIASWINYHTPGDHAPVHNHTNTYYSGVYYLNAPTNGGGIFFHHPQLMRSRTLKVEDSEKNMWNSDIYYHELRKNTLLVFPSNLPHSTEVNKSNQDRYSLAFNYFIEGQLGHQTSKINLRIITE